MRAMTAAALLALTALSAHASGPDPVGRYYVPFSGDRRNFTPESLTVISPEGSVETHTIHDGRREVRRATYEVEGHRIRVSAFRYVAKCDFVKTEGGDEPQTGTFRRTADALYLSEGGSEMSIAVATPEQARRVLSVPPCG